ncbi:type II toxin-antitoxin system HicB family antitoxin [Candidatus Gottesmanbacteria bacterium]|nr:type II toxin-antitoxin system HicB family antitoxin [Candidatus Gottesmanbacteria bacterium]
MNVFTYRTIIEKDGKHYHGYVPALAGCHTQGKTIEETQKNLQEAMKGWILARKELKWPVPEDGLIETLQTVTIPSGGSQTSVAYA